jgi:hypothetical protein
LLEHDRRRLGRHRLLAPLNRPRVGREQPGKDAQQHRLARSVGAQHHGDPFAAKLQVHAGQHRPAGWQEAHIAAADRQHGQP